MVIRGHISFLLSYIYVFVWLLEESQLQWPVGCCPSESLNSLYSVHSLFFHCCRLLVLCTICSFTIYQEGHCYIVHPGQHHHKNYWIFLLCYVSEPRLHEHGFLDILVRDSAKIELGKRLVKRTQIILFMEHS